MAAALLAAGFGSTIGNLAARPQTLASMPTEELIGQLQRESAQTTGANTSMSVQSFVGDDAPLSFGGDLLGVPLPKVSPVMHELVRRGLAAVPALLDHFVDAQPTKLLIAGDQPGGGPRFGGHFFNKEYDPKDFSVKELPAGVHRINVESLGEDTFAEYRIRVGDLCYVALGQIVGRRLNAARYQQSGLFYVNSPVRTPALAAAARADWEGVAATEFTAYLVHDLDPPDGRRRGRTRSMPTGGRVHDEIRPGATS